MALTPQMKQDIIELIKSGLAIPMLQAGVVKAVHITPQPNGGRIVTIDVQSFTDMSIIKGIQIEQPLNHQYIPIVNQQIILLRIGDFFTRVMVELAEAPFGATADPGEFLIEGGGGGFVYLNNGGDVYISDSVRSNYIKLLSSVGFSIVGDAISLLIKDIGKIIITPENSEIGAENEIRIEKINPNGEPTIVKLTNDKVEIVSSRVEIGRDSDGPKAGSVVSFSPRIGDYSVDPMTGDPIPSSSVEKVAIGSPIPETPS